MRLIHAPVLLILIWQCQGTLASIVIPPLRVQLSPRLLYRNINGEQPKGRSPIEEARTLLRSLDLDHLKYELKQAKFLDGSLLFEMKTNLIALEVVRAWNAKIIDLEDDEYLEDGGTDNKYELIQTEKNFYENSEENPKFDYRILF